jgi:peroxiredoxin
VDSKYTQAAFAKAENYDFQVLADFWPHGEVSKKYGVFLEDKGFANRATFLIDSQGVVVAKFITAPGQARNLGEYQTALKLL